MASTLPSGLMFVDLKVDNAYLPQAADQKAVHLYIANINSKLYGSANFYRYLIDRVIETKPEYAYLHGDPTDLIMDDLKRSLEEGDCQSSDAIRSVKYLAENTAAGDPHQLILDKMQKIVNDSWLAVMYRGLLRRVQVGICTAVECPPA